MSTHQTAQGWYVIDAETGAEFDGPYAEQRDAERAAYELDHRLETLEG